MQYTDEQRASALAVYVEEGPDAAAEAIGVSVRTVYRWAVVEGVSTTAISERTQAATSAAKERARMVRAEVAAALMEQAAKALHAMDAADPKDRQALATTTGILIDKYRLEHGEATERKENVTVTDGLTPDQKRILRDRLARSVRGESEPEGTSGTPEGVGAGVDTSASPRPA